MKISLTYFFFCLLLLASVTATLLIGDTPWSDVWTGALQKLQGLSFRWNPLLDERLPRLIVLLCTGASLAVGGAVTQALFSNPLASPSILGISCGGSLVVILIFIMEWHLDYPYAVPLAAFGGCIATLLFVYLLTRYKGEIQMQNLILTGIAISTLLIAIQGAIMYSLRDRWQLIQMLTEWVAGSTVDRTWKHVHMQLPLTLVGLFGCWFYTPEINILALGEEEAKNLGVDVNKVRWRLFLCIALLTGGSIASVGFIAFFGLVLPHLLRYITGPDNRRLIPLCIVAGGTILLCMDLILRVMEIRAFTIGNLSAIMGGIFFLFLLGNRKRVVC
jgi:iron complex transport system permease protein